MTMALLISIAGGLLVGGVVLLIGYNWGRFNGLEEAARIATGPADDEGGTWCDGEDISWAIQARQIKPVDRAAWCLSVAHGLLDELGDDAELRKIPIELHMGEEYADQLYDVLLATGFAPSRPVRGMGIGEQLGWYKAKNASPMP